MYLQDIKVIILLDMVTKLLQVTHLGTCLTTRATEHASLSEFEDTS